MTLGQLVAALAYKPGWKFKLAGPGGRYLCVFATCPDSLGGGLRTTQHQFEIPAGVESDPREFARWAFAQLLEAEWHESAESFQFCGGRPFWPNHQDEGSPYERVERWERVTC